MVRAFIRERLGMEARLWSRRRIRGMSWRGKGAQEDGLCITDVVLDAVLAAQRGDWRWIKLDWDGMGWE